MIANKPFFICLDRLQVGSYIKHSQNGSELTVEFLPINSVWKTKTITVPLYGEVDDILKDFYGDGGTPGSHSHYKILCWGINKEAKFSKWINKMVPELMKKLDGLKEQTEISQAAFKTQEETITAGTKEVIADVVEEHEPLKKMVSRREDDEKRRRDRFFDKELEE